MQIITAEGRMMVTANWAKLNKNNTLEKYQREVERGDFCEQDMRVTDIVLLSDYEFEEFTNDLMENSFVAGHGGTESTYELPPEYRALSIVEIPEELRERWIEESYRLGILVINTYTGEKIAVDPQGYSYARYVGLLK